MALSDQPGSARRTELSMLSPTAGIDAKPLPDAAARLAALEEQVRLDLRFLDYPVMSWVYPRSHPAGDHVFDVVIVGGGQGGLATAFGLRREKVDNVLVLDRADPGREGPWITYARMLTFRSPKHVTGPDLGVPSLTPQAWYVAVFGEEAWAGLGKWPRWTWQDYLIWYRKVLDLPVRNCTKVTRIEPDGDYLRVLAEDTVSGEPLSFVTRKLVLATGIEGNGDWRLPDLPFETIPTDRYAHTNWEFDCAPLRGKRVAVLGAGASAFDTAATAAEMGASLVHQFVRRAQIPCVNPFRWMEKSGFLRHFGSMDDDARWQWMQAITQNGQPPTQDGVNRCAAQVSYRITTGVTWTDLKMVGDDVEVTLSDGSKHLFDFLVIGTGYTVDVGQRPELTSFADAIALWRDRFTPPAGQETSPVAQYPYLAGDLAFQEKVPGSAPWLANIHNFTYVATASVGFSGASLTGMKYGIERLLGGLTRFFWLADADRYLSEIRAYNDIDLDVIPLEPHRIPALTEAKPCPEQA